MSLTPIEFFDEVCRAHHKRLSIALGAKPGGGQMGINSITHHSVSEMNNCLGNQLEQTRPLSFIYTPSLSRSAAPRIVDPDV